MERRYSALWCAVRWKGEAYVIHVYGELDLATVPDLEAELDRALDSGAPRIVVDLDELAAIDSVGLRTLVLFNERCEERGVTLRIRRGSRRLHRVFETAGLDERLPFVD